MTLWGTYQLWNKIMICLKFETTYEGSLFCVWPWRVSWYCRNINSWTVLSYVREVIRSPWILWYINLWFKYISCQSSLIQMPETHSMVNWNLIVYVKYGFNNLWLQIYVNSLKKNTYICRKIEDKNSVSGCTFSYFSLVKRKGEL